MFLEYGIVMKIFFFLIENTCLIWSFQLAFVLKLSPKSENLHKINKK